ncbi:GNAT family N-acetyltransferase [Erythrobacter sp. Alg231-14]|uniref:GNAT family N-acetyltransferase n=1 Tax=Erythrobacter sp. Alg231-14 TaxID=1922225 RepID=UPI000D55CA5C
MLIRPADDQDGEAIWRIVEPVIRAGETYAIDRDIRRDDAIAYWMGTGDAGWDQECFVAELDGVVMGTYYLRRNQGGGGGHVCNCGYMVSSDAQGKGLGRTLCKHSMIAARNAGFTAMQFNFVVSTNTGAVALWRELGFDIVGTVPKGFDHPEKGLVDALVMHRTL